MGRFLSKSPGNRGAEVTRAAIYCIDYNPICASMGGHLSFHGAAAS